MATQVEIAGKLGCSQQFLSLWKKGKKDIRKSTAISWGKVLNVDPARLVFDPVENRPNLIGLDN